MAKQIKQQVIEVDDASEYPKGYEPPTNGHRPTGFTNSRGVWVECLPIEPQYLESIRERVRREFVARGEPIEPPTYEMEVFGGGKKTVPHDEASVQTPEEKEAWAAHKDAEARLNAEMTRRVIKALSLRGVANTPTEAWTAEQKLLGFELPADPLQLKLDYVSSELIVKDTDVKELMYVPVMMSFTGLTDEEYANLEHSFRGFVESFFAGRRDTTGEPEAAG